MSNKLTTQDLLGLCCAACGPLSRDEVRHFFAEAVADKALSSSSSLIRVSSQPDYPRLKKKYDAMPLLRRLCEGVMAQRKADRHSYSVYIPEHMRCIAAARYALLTGDVIEFHRLYRLYRGMPRIGVRAESALTEFWDEVLGSAWLGIEMLPGGAAKEELRALTAARYTLLPLPAEVKLDAAELPYMLSLGWGMLRADLSLKPRSSSHALADDDRDADALMARAYWNVWAGSWENALRYFLRLFRAREAQVHGVASPHGGAFLLVATIAAIRAGAPQRTIELWVRVAREIILSALTESDKGVYADIAAFFDGLMQWDAVENRRCRQFESTPQPGPLASIPMAFASVALVSKTRVHLPLKRLVADIISVHKSGLHLLAFYAAGSLIQAFGVENAELEDLLPLQRACSFAPLCNQAVAARPTPVDSQWPQLISAVENMRGNAQRWLYWDLTIDRYGSLTSIEPRLVERRPQGAGKKLALDEVLDPDLVDCQDKWDLAMVALVKSLDGSSLQGVPLMAEALVGHPRVRLIDGSYHRSVQVRASRPVIHAVDKGESIEFSMDAQQFTRISISEGELTLPAFNGRMQGVVDLFSHGAIALDASQVEQLCWFVARMADSFDIEGELPDHLLQPEPATPSFIVHASVYDNGYLFDLDVRHHPDCAAHSLPGQGERSLLLSPNGVPTCIIRDFDEEIAAARALMEDCPVLRSVEEEDFQWLFLRTGDALQALYELGRCGVRVQWQAAPALEVVEPASDSLRVSVLAERAGWFEIGAELKVDEEQVMRLKELLDCYRERKGNFLSLGEKRYLYLSPVLMEQLQRLSESVHSVRKRYVLPMAAVPSLAIQWPGAELPNDIAARRDVLHECDESQAPAGLKTPLRDYQLQGYRWLLARARAGLGACLADDMGLGKTLQALALMQELAPGGPSLVIVPASLSFNWFAEAERHTSGLRLRPWAEVRQDVGALQAYDIVVTTYGQLTTGVELLKGVSWNVLALDEAQAIKNPVSRRAQIVCQLQASVRICLTGTPIENGLMDLWSVMHFLNPMLLGPKEDYKRAGKVDVTRLHHMVAPLVLRRKKEDVLPQLPPITEIEMNVELSPEERALYESCRSRALEHVQNGGAAATLLAELTRLRRLCCHGKLALESFSAESSKFKMMTQLVEDLLASDHSILIFSQFTDVLDLAQESLESMGVNSLRLDGATPPAHRGERVRLFQEGAARVFLISLRAGGVGLDLTAADYVILLDPWWNPAVEAQAVSRSHRYGQRNPVTLCRLIARDTIEERIMHMHEAKLALAESVIHEGTMPLETLRDILLQG